MSTLCLRLPLIMAIVIVLGRDGDVRPLLAVAAFALQVTTTVLMFMRIPQVRRAELVYNKVAGLTEASTVRELA